MKKEQYKQKCSFHTLMDIAEIETIPLKDKYFSFILYRPDSDHFMLIIVPFLHNNYLRYYVFNPHHDFLQSSDEKYWEPVKDFLDDRYYKHYQQNHPEILWERLLPYKKRPIFIKPDEKQPDTADGLYYCMAFVDLILSNHTLGMCFIGLILCCCCGCTKYSAQWAEWPVESEDVTKVLSVSHICIR